MLGAYQPLLVGALFHAQSRNWQLLTGQHLTNVANACSRFCADLLGTVCPKDNFAGQLGLIIEDALKIRAEKPKMD
jgi:hypothetical protein